MRGPASSRLDLRGRLSRGSFGRLFIRLNLLTTLLLCVTIAVGSHGLRAGAFVGAGTAIAIFVSSVLLAIPRLHDRDRSGWWLLVYLAIAVLGFVPIERHFDVHPILVTSYAILSFAFTVWFLFETLGRRGTCGPNRYGPDPSQSGA